MTIEIVVNSFFYNVSFDDKSTSSLVFFVSVIYLCNRESELFLDINPRFNFRFFKSHLSQFPNLTLLQPYASEEKKKKKKGEFPLWLREQ